MRRAHPAPASGDRDKDVRQLPDKGRLVLGREHEISVAPGDRGERREDAAADTEIDSAHVRAFFRALKTERDVLEVGGGHSGLFLS